MKLGFLLLLMIPGLVRALEIDEKLTVRIIRTSETKKTIMVNRGTEDGLVEGDHARFIVTAGIVARAVCVRVSPSRSVWSVYRLVNADFIVDDSVMALKISPPVKITKDETQALVQDDVPTRTTVGVAPLGIPLADGAQDLTEGEKMGEDMAALERGVWPTSIPERTVEVLGLVHISGLSAFSSPESGGLQFSNSHSYYHIGLGGEWYPQREREWFSRLSLTGGLNIIREDAQAYNGVAVTNSTLEFSGGLNWHPFALPSATMTFIPYFHLSANSGSHASDFSQGTLNPDAEAVSISGTSLGFAVGFGYKFYTPNGFGARVLLEYYRRSETYSPDDITLVSTNRLVAGPRLLLGLSYRF